MSVIRIFAKLDDAFKLIAEKLHLTIKDRKVQLPDGDIFTIPYDGSGKKVNYEILEMTLRTKIAK